MAFTATTREVMQQLGVLDPKTLHRRREDYYDQSIDPNSKIFRLGVHYRRKSPSSTQVVWDPDLTIRAWTEATRIIADARDPQPTSTSSPCSNSCKGRANGEKVSGLHRKGELLLNEIHNAS